MSPPPPYPETYARFKLAAVAFMVPVMALHFIPAWMFGRAASFGFGAALWGRPVISKIITFIPRIAPNLKIVLDPRNSILSRAPTNAQLMLYLYRAAEDIGDPLPPPPAPPMSDTQKKALSDTAPSPQAGEDDLEEARRKEAKGQKMQAVGHRTRAGAKRKIAKVFRKVGRKVAGWHGDVAVDGKEKPVRDEVRSGLLINRLLLNSRPGCSIASLESRQTRTLASWAATPATCSWMVKPVASPGFHSQPTLRVTTRSGMPTKSSNSPKQASVYPACLLGSWEACPSKVSA